MAEHLKVVSLGSIDEGRFMQACNEAFTKLQEEMVKFANVHGDKAEKAKGEMNIKIVVGCLDPQDGAFGLVTSLKTTLPAPPAKATIAMAGKRDTDHPRLFCRPTGTGKDTPLQQILCEEDGSDLEIDKTTGEVLKT